MRVRVWFQVRVWSWVGCESQWLRGLFEGVVGWAAGMDVGKGMDVSMDVGKGMDVGMDVGNGMDVGMNVGNT